MRIDLTPAQAEAIMVLCETADFGRMDHRFLEALLDARDNIAAAYKLNVNLNPSVKGPPL
jgi:hypothetical protein